MQHHREHRQSGRDEENQIALATAAVNLIQSSRQSSAAGTTLAAASGVERATGRASLVHRARKPTGDERARRQYSDQNSGVQERLAQLLYCSRKPC